MNWRIFLHSYLFVCLSVIYPLIDQCHGVPPIPYPKPSQIERISSVINQGKDIVNRLRCLKGWKRFGSSCYYSSIIRSTPHTANETCHHLPVNHSHLMHIRHPIELSYAAHLFLTNNLTTLLVQTDPQLFKDKPYLDVISATDRANWRATEEKLYQARLEFEQDDNQNKDDDEANDFQWFDRIRNLCQGLAWNVMKNDSRLFSFTTSQMSNTMTCALSDADLNSTYEHTCQYVLDFCFGSLICKRGECVSGVSSFKCLCDWFFEGDRCDKLSRRMIEAFIALIACLIIGLGMLIMKICQKIKKYCCTTDDRLNPPTADGNQETEDATIANNKSFWENLKEQIKARWLFLMVSFILFCLLLIIPAYNQYRSFPLRGVDLTNSQAMIDKASSLLHTCNHESFFPLEERIFLSISLALTGIFSVLALLFKRKSTENRSYSKLKVKNRQSRRPGSARNDRRSSSIPLQRLHRGTENPEGRQFLGTPQSEEHQAGPLTSLNPAESSVIQIIPFGDVRPPPGHMVPFDPHDKTDRIETAAVLAILTFEILKVFDDLLLAITQSPEDGVLTKLGKQIVVAIVIGFRYYPILISLRLKDGEVQSIVLCVIRLFAFVYVFMIVVYTIYRESVCFDFIPQSENFTVADQVLLRIKLGSRFIIFGLVVNTPHFLFLSYIGGKFFVRWIFGQPRKDEEDDRRNRSRLDALLSQRLNTNAADNRSYFKQFCDFIYEPNKNFTFSTICTSMYTVNFIILWHLTCTFIFLYTTRTMSPVSFLTNTLQQKLNIKMKDTLFHPEIIASAIGTALIYAFQLLRSMVNLRRHIEYYSFDQRASLVEERDVNKDEAPAKATKYPGYLIRYTVGGYVITFHLLLFVVIIPRLITNHSHVLRYIPDFLIFILILYVLQLLIAQIISKIIRNRKQGQRSPSQNTSANSSAINTETPDNQSICTKCRKHWSRFRDNFKNILQYFMLVANCFIGVASSISRLLLIFLINIVSMNRVESSSFADPFTALDRANIAYWHFVYQETYVLQSEGLRAPVVPVVQQQIDDEESEELDEHGHPKVASPTDVPYNTRGRASDPSRLGTSV